MSEDSHEIYLVLHQIVPQSLYDPINSFTFNMKSTRDIIFEFFLSPQHNSFLRAWERTQGISKKKKWHVKRAPKKHALHTAISPGSPRLHVGLNSPLVVADPLPSPHDLRTSGPAISPPPE
uniref:Uncharacterized protein n=1 Tax=Rhizophagus irregularis (strain DAOM 181602 / DAOM 197198 / MUCL 43194) TaxID=747089 RepID=U9U3U1_RHIID